MRIGQIVKNRREELGMSQTDLAKLTGYSDKSAISRIESGENDVPRKKLALFAKTLIPCDCFGTNAFWGRQIGKAHQFQNVIRNRFFARIRK